MARPEALRLLRIARRDLRMARLLLLLQEAGIEIKALLPLRAFTRFAVQYRYDDEPEELCLDRAAWCDRADGLIEQVEGFLV